MLNRLKCVMDTPTTPFSASARGGEWKVTYREPSGTIEFEFELGIGRPIFWVPSEKWWVENAPDWAQGRREEIVERTVQRAFGIEGATLEDCPWR